MVEHPLACTLVDPLLHGSLVHVQGDDERVPVEEAPHQLPLRGLRWTGSVSICRHTSAYASGSTRPMGVVPKNGSRNVSSSTCSKRRGTGYRGIEPQFGAAEQRRHLGPPAVDDLAGASLTWPLRSALTAKWLKPLLGRPKISQSVSRPLPARPMQPDPIPPYGKEISVSRSPRQVKYSRAAGLTAAAHRG